MAKTEHLQNPDIDWKKLAYLFMVSRAMDELEEQVLVPEKKVLYQFSARGHELGQILLGMQLTNQHDAASAYYRSRPLMLSLGLSVEDALAAPMAKSGGYSNGRDIGVVCNMPGIDGKGPTVLPMAGDVGSQYTPAIGWAQAIKYHHTTLDDKAYAGAISTVLGGDGSVATNGFWSALTIATTQNLPILFYIEDNAYGISVESSYQTPGGNIANNLYSFKNLKIYKGDGTNPKEASALIDQATGFVRNQRKPALLRLTMPRLNGHSYQDNQAYKDEELLKQEQEDDPLEALKKFMLSEYLDDEDWQDVQQRAEKAVQQASESAQQRPEPDTTQTERYLFAESKEDGTPDLPQQGGLSVDDTSSFRESHIPNPGKQRINMVEGIRKTLDYELETNENLVIFGEDVGAKGGVHAVTMGLQSKHGKARVFDTSLSEEGIIGRAVGMAYAGLMPVPEIQFRKYADPATEQIKNAGTIRWRTANKFAAPMVVRMPGGFAKVGDPWHSESNESFFTHCIGWQVAFPSNVEDAVGLLRTAMRGQNPTIFFEHRNLLDARYARRPYPGDEYVVPFGKARELAEGTDLTMVTWGAMCERCEQAAKEMELSADILDLRTLMPWDKDSVLKSLKKTNRCLIVHEDAKTAGFGAEITSYLMKEGFEWLDAPVERHTMPDIPVPHNIGLMNSVLPGVESISKKIEYLLAY